MNGIRSQSAICSSTSTSPARNAIDAQISARGPSTAHWTGSSTTTGHNTPKRTTVWTTAPSCSARAAGSSVMRNTQFARGSIGSTSAARTASTITNTSVNGAATTVLTISFSGERTCPMFIAPMKLFMTRPAPHAATATNTPWCSGLLASVARVNRLIAVKIGRRVTRWPNAVALRRLTPADASAGRSMTRSNRR